MNTKSAIATDARLPFIRVSKSMRYRRFLLALSGSPRWKLGVRRRVQRNKAKRYVEKPIAGCSTGYIAVRLKCTQLSSVNCKVSSVTPKPVFAGTPICLRMLEPNQSSMAVQVQTSMLRKNLRENRPPCPPERTKKDTRTPSPATDSTISFPDGRAGSFVPAAAGEVRELCRTAA